MKKIVLWIASTFTAVNMLVAMSLNVEAASCESSDGIKCSGECCHATKGSCKAGPCDVILK